MAFSIHDLREQYRATRAKPREVVEAALRRANSNAGRNVYLARDEAWTQHESEELLTSATRSSEAFESRPLGEFRFR